jgi:hypothetical protein
MTYNAMGVNHENIQKSIDCIRGGSDDRFLRRPTRDRPGKSESTRSAGRVDAVPEAN